MKQAIDNSGNMSPAKITRPHSGDILARERLYALLDRECAKPLLWITGPGGSGKTSLVSGWIEERRLPCLWYQLDTGDSDLSSFFYHLGHAVRLAAPGKKQPLPLFTPEYRAVLPVFARRFFEELFSRLKPPAVVVFDNCQEVPADSPLHEVIAKGIEAMPADMTVLVLSREEPSPGYARLRAGKQVGFVGWHELRFVPEEIAALSRTIPWKACREEVCPAADTLYERTDGWAAGLVLLLESLRRVSARHAAIPEGGSHCAVHLPDLHCQGVFDYFAGELFGRLDSSIRDFLLKTALFPSMTEKLAERLSGSTDAGRILRWLSRSHFFTDWHPGLQPVYQYHPLFREFLLAQAREQLTAAEISGIRHRAAVLLEEAGQPEEAVELYRDNGDTESVVRLVMTHESALLAQGRHTTLENWLACIPSGRLEQDPCLLKVAGLCRLPFNLTAARSLLEKALFLLEERHDFAVALAVYGCLMEVTVMEGESFILLDRYLERAYKLAQHDAAAAAGMAGTVLFALSFRAPRHPTVPYWLGLAEEAVMKACTAAGVLKLSNHLMAYYLLVGEFNRMAWLMETVQPYRKEAEKVPTLRLLCILLEAYYCANAKGDAETGVGLAREGLALAREAGIVVYNFWFSYLIAIYAIRSGEVAAAAAVIDGMLPVTSTAPAARMADVQYLRGGLAFRRGDLREALEYFSAAAAIFERVGNPISQVLCRIHAAHTNLFMGRLTEAHGQLQLAEQLGWGGSWFCAYIGLLNKALAACRSGEEEAGLEIVGKAFSIGSRYGIRVQPFWNSQAMVQLCELALAAGIETGFVTEHVRRQRLVPDSLCPVAVWPYPVRILTFGGFKIQLNGQPLAFSGKVQKKPLELLKALVALGGSDVPQEQITDMLWPDADGDTAHSSFKFTLHQLRKLLGNDACIQVREGRICLDYQLCYTDVQAFRCLTGQANELLCKREQGWEKRLADISGEVAEIYRGQFLGDDRTAPWIVVARERFTGAFLRLMEMVSTCHEESGQWEKAAHLYERILEIHEYDEDIHRRLMHCLLKLDRPSAAMAVYNRCCRALARHLSLAPSRETIELAAVISRRLLAAAEETA